MVTGTQDKKIPAGYKQTEVGVIPSDWDSKALSDVAPLQRGFDLPTPQLRNGNVPVVYSNGILNYHDKAMAAGPGVVTGRSGTIGKVNYIDTNYWPHNTTLWVTSFKGNDPKFIYYLYQFVKLDRFGTGSGVPTLNRNDVHDFRVALPPPREQTVIASVLSEADAMIEAFNKLITKKRAARRGAMQELLTGKRRLSGYSEEWEVSEFIGIVQKYIDYRGRTPKKLGMEWGGGDILALSANNVQMGKIETREEANFGSLELYRKWMVQGECEKDDVLLTTEAPLGNVAKIPDDKKYILSQRVLLIRPKPKITRNYLFYLLAGTYFQNALSKNASGSTAQGIQRQRLDKIEVYFPKSISEQTAIASVLSDTDAEIDALEQRLGKYKALKQGMMQVLLTGKIRLPH